MKLKLHHICFSVFEKDVLTGTEIRELTTQNKSSLIQLSGIGRLPQQEQHLQDAALAHSVQAAQQS